MAEFFTFLDHDSKDVVKVLVLLQSDVVINCFKTIAIFDALCGSLLTSRMIDGSPAIRISFLVFVFLVAYFHFLFQFLANKSIK